MNRKTSRDLDLGGVFLCINARPSFAGGQTRRGWLRRSARWPNNKAFPAHKFGAAA